METKHTPGPWEYDDSRRAYQKDVIRHNGLVVAVVTESSFDSTREQKPANGRLLAAAPALLEALRAVLAYGDDDPKSLAKAHAAIAQAEGE